MDFFNSYQQGFARVAACTIETSLADPAANARAVLEVARACDADAVALAVFPELTLTGYSIDDLHLQQTLLDEVEAAVGDLLEGSADLLPVLVVGAPVRHRLRVYNLALVIHRGRLLGAVPKSYLPTYREFYESRQFASGAGAGREVTVAGQTVPCGADLLFDIEDVPGLVVHVEICEDMWVPVPPSSLAALAGATVLTNLSGSPITIGRAENRALLCQSASARCVAAYIYSAAGKGESTTDLSWDGQTLIYENGALLAAGERFARAPVTVVADVDLDLIAAERLRMGTFDDNRRDHTPRTDAFRRIGLRLEPPAGDLGLRREVQRFPFVPADETRLSQDCFEAYNIQVSGLEQRMRALGRPKIVIGISGGLDSTHALIVAAKALDRENRPRTDILAFSLPGFATGDHTRNNAHRLARSLGVTFAEVDIRPAARQMLSDLDHPFSHGEPQYDVTFENVQAGLRTDYLFRIANQRGGLVLGTGDLSELALGWSTYGVGDQMSHYNVNSGVPKTLMQHLIRWVISTAQFDPETLDTLASVLDTEITPELVPTTEGEAPQSTESKIGPYALQDFSLYHVLRWGFRPSRVAFLAWHAWHDEKAGSWPPGYRPDQRNTYDLPEIKAWLKVFVQRFYQFSQFKRSAMPNGPKVSSGGSLSPRGDWRAPSDASARIWLDEIDRNVP